MNKIEISTTRIHRDKNRYLSQNFDFFSFEEKTFFFQRQSFENRLNLLCNDRKNFDVDPIESGNECEEKDRLEIIELNSSKHPHEPL